MVEQRERGPTSQTDDDSVVSNHRDPSSDDQDDEPFWRNIPGADVRVITTDGKAIPAHTSVLACSNSPVLESMAQRHHVRGGVDKKDRPAASIVVPLLGVPRAAVVSFLRCFYHNAGFSRGLTTTDAPASVAADTETIAKEAFKHGVHLLVLSHALQVPWLKRASAAALAGSLTPDNVVDMLQLARQCDAPDLQVHCMAMIRCSFKEVQHTEGYQFLQKNDPWLELDVLEQIDEVEKSERRTRRRRSEIRVYAELGDAMQCLEYICSQGCHLQDEQGPSSTCAWGDTCRRLQQLILHFKTCQWRKRLGVVGSCRRCVHLWHLLRLHATMCDHDGADSCCKVPFCRQFKQQAANQTTGNRDQVTAGADRWQLLAKKVASVKAVLSASKRRTHQSYATTD